MISYFKYRPPLFVGPIARPGAPRPLHTHPCQWTSSPPPLSSTATTSPSSSTPCESRRPSPPHSQSSSFSSSLHSKSKGETDSLSFLHDLSPSPVILCALFFFSFFTLCSFSLPVPTPNCTTNLDACLAPPSPPQTQTVVAFRVATNVQSHL